MILNRFYLRPTFFFLPDRVLFFAIEKFKCDFNEIVWLHQLMIRQVFEVCQVSFLWLIVGIISNGNSKTVNYSLSGVEYSYHMHFCVVTYTLYVPSNAGIANTIHWNAIFLYEFDMKAMFDAIMRRSNEKSIQKNIHLFFVISSAWRNDLPFRMILTFELNVSISNLLLKTVSK